eukprot:c12250_g1_i2.p1 GENE.c12250_g1_i2~~c12250_g1_i2.p1  ORF type:complete len:172 (+),score=28.97 c12250_g1_i2:69-518(+)
MYLEMPMVPFALMFFFWFGQYLRGKCCFESSERQCAECSCLFVFWMLNVQLLVNVVSVLFVVVALISCSRMFPDCYYYLFSSFQFGLSVWVQFIWWVIFVFKISLAAEADFFVEFFVLVVVTLCAFVAAFVTAFMKFSEGTEVVLEAVN